ncbi:MAG: ABC transporter permease [Malacoplasma sp.]|nr:ABC transporter permease [Malacoplasma sp.]
MKFKRIFLNIKNYYNKHFVVIDIINLYFWKSIIGPIFYFVIIPLFSIGLILINKEYVSLTMPSVISTPLISISIWLLSPFIFELKKNSIVERVFVFSKKPIYSNAIVAIYCFVLVFSNLIWNIFIIFLISLNRNIFENNVFEKVDWGSVFFIGILGSFLSVSISSLLYTFLKSTLLIQLIGFIISAFLMFFSGSIIPMNTLNSVNALNYISYFSPFKYINSSFVIAINSGIGPNNLDGITIFDLNSHFRIGSVSDSIVLFNSYDLYLDLFVPLFLTALFFSFSLNSKMCRKK